MTTTQTDAIMVLADTYSGARAAWHVENLYGTSKSYTEQLYKEMEEARAALLAALRARDQQGPIKTWQERIEETCPALGPMHIHASVEEVNDAMQAEINDLRAALHEQAREGEAVAPSAILARGRFHFFGGDDGEPDDWEWFEEGTNCEHGCIDAVIVRADAIAAPQPAHPSEPAQPEQGELVGPDQIENIVDRYVDEYEFTDGENAHHSPNEFEQMLIKDAFYGLLVDEEWDAAWGAHIASLQYAQPVALPMTDDQINLMVHSQHFDPSYKLKASDMVCLNWYKLGLRDGERAHGIGGGR